MGSYGGRGCWDLRVGLEARVGIGLGVGRGMSARLDAVASEAAEALTGEETPGNGEWKVILCFASQSTDYSGKASCIPGQCYRMNLDE